MFMCKGRCVYHGSAKDVVPYFAEHGYQWEPYENPADYALDVLIDVSRKPETLTRLSNIYSTTHADVLPLFYRQDSSIGSENIECERRKYKVKATCSIGTEIFYLSQRTLRNAMRNPALALSQTLVSIILGLLVGLLFYDLKKTTEPGVQNRLGAIFFIVISQIFSNLTALEPLIKERVLFIHEHTSAVALIIVILVLVVMMMFSGFLIDLPSVFVWLSWIQWISAFRYASNVLTINEFQDLTFCWPNQTNFCPMSAYIQLIRSKKTK
ncbi:unnamed protein product [Rotaria sordida]|uniref:ABC-2 type transporter transmembrane domain-containing protein n=1 Tax=Rotaria sordida TaxID=392033 RepID=A0A815VVC2_9BILA|nr:unnamed protein product [Rotaria sordida]CAF1537793.1 unnamed protein product [Rotaria sordida]